VSALGDMEAPRAEYASGDWLRPRQPAPHEAREQSEAALLEAISHMSITPALHDHVRCRREYDLWRRTSRLGDGDGETERALQAKSLHSVAAARFAAHACGRHLRAEGVEPERMVILVKQVVERLLSESSLDRPDEVRMQVLTWAIEGYYAGD